MPFLPPNQQRQSTEGSITETRSETDFGFDKPIMLSAA